MQANFKKPPLTGAAAPRAAAEPYSQVKPDRRRLRRLPVQMEVMLRGADGKFRRWPARNLSLEGIFVATPDRSILSQPLTDLAIRLPQLGAPRVRLLRARPAHARADGIGFSFPPQEDSAQADLYELFFTQRRRRVD